jgi:hypothetical protein
MRKRLLELAGIIQTGPYNGPEGPYTSIYTSAEFFIVRTNRGFSIVKNEEQSNMGTPFPTLRDAREWMKENGFSIKKK